MSALYFAKLKRTADVGNKVLRSRVYRSRLRNRKGGCRSSRRRNVNRFNRRLFLYGVNGSVCPRRDDFLNLSFDLNASGWNRFGSWNGPVDAQILFYRLLFCGFFVRGYQIQVIQDFKFTKVFGGTQNIFRRSLGFHSGSRCRRKQGLNDNVSFRRKFSRRDGSAFNRVFQRINPLNNQVGRRHRIVNAGCRRRIGQRQQSADIG